MTIDREILNLINQERSNAGLNPLLLHSQLDSAANNHSEDMALEDFFSHTSSNGTNWSHRIAAVYRGSRLAENISAGLATPAGVVQQWMNSRPHRANILDPNLEHIGIGYYHLPNDTGSVNYNHYWTLTFGAGGDPPDPPGDETISVGTAPNYTPYSNSNYLNEDITERVYSFTVNDRSSINLNLHDITSGDDADLYLYRDDGDGVFESNQDQELRKSRRGDNFDDSINYLAQPGSYFARVEHYASSQGRLDYELDLSATPDNPSPADDPTEAPNLLPMEVNVGDVFRSGPGPQNFYGSIGETNTADTYAFSVPSFSPDSVYLMRISLTGLSDNADIRLIEDLDGDRIVDSGEVFGSSTNDGSLSESIDMLLEGGDYFVQVYQYSGDTSYQLTFA